MSVPARLLRVTLLILPALVARTAFAQASPDGGVTDGGVTDGGVTDGGVTDGGVTDGGVTDGGVTDGGVTVSFVAGNTRFANLSTYDCTHSQPFDFDFAYLWESGQGAEFFLSTSSSCDSPVGASFAGSTACTGTEVCPSMLLQNYITLTTMPADGMTTDYGSLPLTAAPLTTGGIWAAYTELAANTSTTQIPPYSTTNSSNTTECGPPGGVDNALLYICALIDNGATVPYGALSLSLNSSEPDAPGQPTVTPLNLGLSVSWPVVANASYYYVHVQLASEAGVDVVPPVGTSGTSATVIGLQNGTTYNVYVVAADGSGTNPPTTSNLSGPSPAASGTPSSLDASGPSGGGVSDDSGGVTVSFGSGETQFANLSAYDCAHSQSIDFDFAYPWAFGQAAEFFLSTTNSCDSPVGVSFAGTIACTGTAACPSMVLQNGVTLTIDPSDGMTTDYGSLSLTAPPLTTGGIWAAYTELAVDASTTQVAPYSTTNSTNTTECGPTGGVDNALLYICALINNGGAVPYGSLSLALKSTAPDVPDQPTVTPIDSGFFVTWPAVTNAAFYYVHVQLAPTPADGGIADGGSDDADGGVTSDVVPPVVTNGPSASIYGLRNGTAYNVYLVAADGAGTNPPTTSNLSGPSPLASGTPVATPPLPPDGGAGCSCGSGSGGGSAAGAVLLLALATLRRRRATTAARAECDAA